MNRYFFLFLLGSCWLVNAQDLRSVNYNYLYNPEESIQFQFALFRINDEVWAQYQVKSNAPVEIKWALRDALSDREGVSLKTLTSKINAGIEKFSGLSTGKILVAIVSDSTKKNSKVYYKQLEQEKLPPFCVENSQGNYLSPQTLTQIFPTTSVYISYYSTDFPPASSPHNLAQSKVSPLLKADSIFRFSTEEKIVFTKSGLYLFQTDTSKAEGRAWRVEDDYPKYATLESLADPLVYICTKQEFEKLKLAKGDKKLFDKTILSITGSTERAKIFIRNYFRRVELANTYFTSYKEGWKNDRGMIYIIFGLPEEVFKFADREIWDYKINGKKVRFQFMKLPTIFDPDNYVLIREKKYAQTWFQTIDLWRKARF